MHLTALLLQPHFSCSAQFSFCKIWHATKASSCITACMRHRTVCRITERMMRDFASMIAWTHHIHIPHTHRMHFPTKIYIYKYLCVGRVWQNHVLKCSSVRVASSNFPKVVVRFTNCSGISICETGGNKIWWHAKGLTIRIFETNIHNYGVTFAVNSAMRSRSEWTHSLSITGLYILSYTSHICVYLSVCWTKLRCSKAPKKI